MTESRPQPSIQRSKIILSGAKNLSSIFPLRCMPKLSANALKLSSRAKRGICFFFLASALTALAVNSEPKRPKILGIAYVQISSSDPAIAKGFYEKVGAMRANYATSDLPELGVCPTCNIIERFRRREEQVILIKYPASAPASHIDKIVFRVSDVKKLQGHLSAQGAEIRSAASALGYFEIVDPGGQQIGFLQQSGNGGWTKDMSPALLGIIHAGFIVRDRAATEHFYRDILGFRPYWHGGMKDDQTDWVSMQVPDGTDWLEFMVNVSSDADQRLRGIMNHIAIGVTDIHATEQRLRDTGLKLTEEPHIGRGGKWQLNVYDPDGTRIEFMEFKPVQKPCCSEYTGPHPGPQQ
jgi:catechol 2,3-dioxygenase-like lactoylglutathione lyase family enzyme